MRPYVGRSLYLLIKVCVDCLVLNRAYSNLVRLTFPSKSEEAISRFSSNIAKAIIADACELIF